MRQSEHPVTRSQAYAQRAFGRIQMRTEALKGKQRKEFSSFVRRFPTLIHTCGLCQALAFAQAKEQEDYLDDLASVLGQQLKAELLAEARSVPVCEYMNLTRNTLTAAGWLKRYTEALMDEDG